MLFSSHVVVPVNGGDDKFWLGVLFCLFATAAVCVMIWFTRPARPAEDEVTVFLKVPTPADIRARGEMLFSCEAYQTWAYLGRYWEIRVDDSVRPMMQVNERRPS